MAPSKPRNAVYKDSVVAYLALKSHFAISDNHPSDKSLAELSILMLHHIPGQSAFDLSWRGEYYDACVLFARSNDAEMKQNKCSVEQLMQATVTPSSYYNGTAL